MDGRVDAERDRPLLVNREGLSLGVGADELDRVGIGRIVLLVRRRDDVERDPQLLEDRTSLRRGRGENEPHHRFFATQISSAGHLRDHSAENAS